MSQAITHALDNAECKVEDLLDKEGIVSEYKELKNSRLEIL